MQGIGQGSLHLTASSVFRLGWLADYQGEQCNWQGQQMVSDCCTRWKSLDIPIKCCKGWSLSKWNRVFQALWIASRSDTWRCRDGSFLNYVFCTWNAQQSIHERHHVNVILHGDLFRSHSSTSFKPFLTLSQTATQRHKSTTSYSSCVAHDTWRKYPDNMYNHQSVLLCHWGFGINQEYFTAQSTSSRWSGTSSGSNTFVMARLPLWRLTLKSSGQIFSQKDLSVRALNASVHLSKDGNCHPTPFVSYSNCNPCLTRIYLSVVLSICSCFYGWRGELKPALHWTTIPSVYCVTVRAIHWNVKHGTLYCPVSN